MQVEGSYYIGVHFSDQTRACKFHGKVHGLQPTPAAYFSIYLDNAHRNTIYAANLANGGDSHIAIDGGSTANIIIGNHIANCSAWGVEIIDGDNNVIDANVFGKMGLIPADPSW